MSVSATLSTTDLVVEPGSEQHCDVVVSNTGDVVDQFTIDVVGDAAEWAMALPGTLNLMPGTEQVVQIVFAPPRTSETTAGTVPFAVRIRSREDPEGSTVQEGTVEIPPFTEMSAQLVPPKKRGRRRSQFQFAIENRGNTAVPVWLQGYHPEEDGVLDVQLSHTDFDTDPGTVTTVTVTTVPAQRFLKGEPRLHPFVVEMAQDGEDEPTVVDGVMIQEGLVPAWLPKALMIAAAALVALVVLWFALLRPTIASVATQEAAVQADAAAADAQRAMAASDTAAISAHVANPAAAEVAGIPDPRDRGAKPGATPNGGVAGARNGAGGTDGTTATDFRVATAAPVATDGAFTAFTYTAPDNKVLAISDIVLQNPRGDSGLLQVRLGDDVVLEVGLQNFRDLDYHYLNALQAQPGQPVVVAVSCTAPGAGAAQCSPAVSFSARTG